MPQKPVYETILFDDLRFTPEFFEDRKETINEKLSHAGTDLARENGDIFAINQCLHLAISMVLVKTANLNGALDRIRHTQAFHDLDPTTVVTIAMLFKILQTEPASGVSSDERANVRRLRQRFEEINWLVGRSGMEALGMGPS